MDRSNAVVTLWLPLDVNYLRGPHMAGLGAPAKLLHLAGLLWAKENTSDGHLPAGVLPILRAEAGASTRHVRDLVRTGRWHEAGHDCGRCPQPPDGVQVHDWAVHNETAEQLDERRRIETERKADWRRKRQLSRRARLPFPDPAVAAVLDIIAQRRTDNAGARHPERYRSEVLASLGDDGTAERAAEAVAAHPDAPTDLVALYLEGHDVGGNLHHYRKEPA